MNGLIRNEWYASRSTLVWLCLTTLLFWGISLATGMQPVALIFTLIYPLFLISNAPMSSLIRNETDHWTSFAAGLPCTASQLVGVKYLSVLVLSLVYLVLDLFPLLLIHEPLRIMLPGLSLLLLTTAWQLPLAFRLGGIRSRVPGILGCCVLDALYFSVLALYRTAGAAWVRPLMPVVLLLSAAAFAGSWRLSIRWYHLQDR